MTSRQDVKMELYGEKAVRIVNVSAGMAFTLPTTELKADYTIGQYRQQFEYSDIILTVSLNANNPYTALENPWYPYAGEWLINHLNNDTFLENQNLTRLNKTKAYEFTPEHSVGDLEMKQGYDVYRYDIKIEDNENIERPYYSIAVIRRANEVTDYALFVMKSKTNRGSAMNEIVRSFQKITSKGMQKNYFDAGEPIANPKWNEATKAYFDSLMTSNKMNWGVFSYSMPGLGDQIKPENSYYQEILNSSKAMQAGIEAVWEHKYDIFPTYTHIGSGKDASSYGSHEFPLSMAKELAGGNGTNGKPVLQFTYQFTLNNNLVAQEQTPMFDILRGKFDEQFHRLARDIKAYHEPVLFRLNNEMNTDWTSYSGMMTLLDPDIFVMTWQRLYDIFESEGVDNAIWIWNPIAKTCPYCSWGEDLCFFPGKEYVQLLGGTNYEMNNYATEEAAEKIVSFEECYKSLYEKNEKSFSKWKLIISEFACGSGGDSSGELGRNGDVQADWVKGMFECFARSDRPAWVDQIKGAVWFNCNDMADATHISNRLRFFDPKGGYDDLSKTLQAFKEGFKSLK